MRSFHSLHESAVEQRLQKFVAADRQHINAKYPERYMPSIMAIYALRHASAFLDYAQAASTEVEHSLYDFYAHSQSSTVKAWDKFRSAFNLLSKSFKAIAAQAEKKWSVEISKMIGDKRFRSAYDSNIVPHAVPASDDVTSENARQVLQKLRGAIAEFSKYFGSRPGGYVGTPQYSSPEMAMGGNDEGREFNLPSHINMAMLGVRQDAVLAPGASEIAKLSRLTSDAADAFIQAFNGDPEAVSSRKLVVLASRSQLPHSDAEEPTWVHGKPVHGKGM